MAKMIRGPQTVLELDFTNENSPVAGNSLVRIDKALSEINQRLYRQHMTYYAEAELQTDQDQGLIEVYTLATNWWCLGALRMAKRMHDRAMKEERGATGQARWYDFRIGGKPENTDDLSVVAIDGAYQRVPVTTTGGEYEFSTVEDSAGNGKTFNLFGVSSSTRYNVFTEWDNMGAVDKDPTTVSAGGYDNIVDDIQSENQTSLLGLGNAPPYNPTTTNVRMVKVGELYQTQGGSQSLTTGMFAAPLGLVWLKGFNTTQGDTVRINVAPGNYKGVLASAL